MTRGGDILAGFTEQEKEAARAIFETMALAGSFSVAWEDTGDYRKFLYMRAARAALTTQVPEEQRELT